MKLFEAARQAGKHGAITRKFWPKEDAVVVGDLQKIGDQASIVLFLVTPDGIGNYEAEDEDVHAGDWEVVARSSRRFEIKG